MVDNLQSNAECLPLAQPQPTPVFCSSSELCWPDIHSSQRHELIHTLSKKKSFAEKKTGFLEKYKHGYSHGSMFELLLGIVVQSMLKALFLLYLVCFFGLFMY